MVVEKEKKSSVEIKFLFSAEETVITVDYRVVVDFEFKYFVETSWNQLFIFHIEFWN